MDGTMTPVPSNAANCFGNSGRSPDGGDSYDSYNNVQQLAAFLALGLEQWPFEAKDAEDAGDIRASLERAGTTIGPYDLLIAAQARRRGVVLITANSREFARVPGLKSEDWSLDS